MRTVCATRYVTPLREGGSMPAIVEADDDGLYVVKFRGAGQGPKALVAELVAGELGRRLRAAVPGPAVGVRRPARGRAQPPPGVQGLVNRGAGPHFGPALLPRAPPFQPA